jgi:hypothetical protein
MRRDLGERAVVVEEHDERPAPRERADPALEVLRTHGRELAVRRGRGVEELVASICETSWILGRFK